MQIDKKTRAKRGSKMYFNADTQAAILKYAKSNDRVERELLYRNYINEPINKLAEILIHKGKFYYAGTNMDEIKSDVILHILEKINNYNETKGRAYSYFTVIVWRFLINLNNTNYHKIKKQISTNSYGDIDGLEEKMLMYDPYTSIDKEEFFDYLINYLNDNLTQIFPKKRDLDIANAILEIFKRRYNLENFNKKALYIYIREMTNCKSAQITVIVNAFRGVVEKAYDDYLEYGCLFKNKLYM